MRRGRPAWHAHVTCARNHSNSYDVHYLEIFLASSHIDMGNKPSTRSTTRVTPIEVKQKAVSSRSQEKLKELEIRVRELENELNTSQQRCVDAEARYSQCSDELELTREQLERVNGQLADSRVQSASERATQQVCSIIHALFCPFPHTHTHTHTHTHPPII